MLKNKNLLDLHKIVSMSNTPAKTWKQQRSSNNVNVMVERRLDQIWISQNLLSWIMKCNVIEDQNLNTDHAMLLATLNFTEIVDTKSIASEKSSNFKRKIFDLKKTNEEDWNAFRENIKSKIEYTKIRSRYMETNYYKDINWINGL